MAEIPNEVLVPLIKAALKVLPEQEQKEVVNSVEQRTRPECYLPVYDTAENSVHQLAYGKIRYLSTDNERRNRWLVHSTDVDADGKPVVYQLRGALSRQQQLLRHPHFMLVHRSYCIHFKYLKHFGSGNLHIYMNDETPVPVAELLWNEVHRRRDAYRQEVSAL